MISVGGIPPEEGREGGWCNPGVSSPGSGDQDHAVAEASTPAF